MRGNSVHGADAGQALGDALAANAVLKELDLSTQHDWDKDRQLDASFAKSFAVGLGANRAMTSLNVLNNKLFADGGKALADALKGNQVMKVIDISSNELGYDAHYNSDLSGVIAIGTAVPTMGALEKLRIGANGFKGQEAAKALGDAIAAHTVLKELDLSGGEYAYQKCVAEFAKGFSAGLGANGAKGALVKFDISSNDLRAEGCKALAKALTNHPTMAELDVSSNSMTLGANWGDMSGVIALSNAIPSMGALASLNVSNNNLVGSYIHDAERKVDMMGVQALAAAIPKCK